MIGEKPEKAKILCISMASPDPTRYSSLSMTQEAQKANIIARLSLFSTISNKPN